MLNEKQILKIASDFFKISVDRLSLEFKADFGKSNGNGTYYVELPEKANTLYYLCGAFTCSFGAQINWLSLVERTNVYYSFNNPSDKVQQCYQMFSDIGIFTQKANLLFSPMSFGVGGNWYCYYKITLIS